MKEFNAVEWFCFYACVVYIITFISHDEQEYYEHEEFKVLSVKDANQDIINEVHEFMDDPSLDEFSDIMYGLNRWIGSIFGCKYIPIFPFDGIHIRKCNKRYEEYGHFRSKRHL